MGSRGCTRSRYPGAPAHDRGRGRRVVWRLPGRALDESVRRIECGCDGVQRGDLDGLPPGELWEDSCSTQMRV